MLVHITTCIDVTAYIVYKLGAYIDQEAQLSQRDRATHYFC